MTNDLLSYLKTERAKGISDEQLRNNLIAQGWPTEQVAAALKADLNSPVPLPPSPAPAFSPTRSTPAPVVNVFSTISVEYIIMFIGLWISATTIGALAHALVSGLQDNGQSFSGVAPLSTASLVVALPIFGFMFARLRRREASEPEIRHDHSRRQAIRLTLLVTFVTAIGHVIEYIYSLLNPINYSYESSSYAPAVDHSLDGVIGLLHVAITVIICGTIFAYYWRDIHRSEA